MLSLFSTADAWRSPVSQDRFYWGIGREDSDKDTFSYTKCIDTVCISFFSFLSVLLWFLADFHNFCQKFSFWLLRADKWLGLQ